MLKGISTAILAVIAISQALPQVPGAVATIGSIIRPPRHPGNHVVFVSSDEFLAKSYLNLLAGQGVRTDYRDPSELDNLPRDDPDLVIFGSGAREPEPLTLSGDLRHFFDGDVKVMAMGSLGSLTLQQIAPFSPLSFRHSIGIETSEVRLDSRIDKRFRGTLPTGRTFKLYQENGQVSPGLAVFDEGSLPLLGAIGIAELGDTGGCTGHSWPVARQGNHLFWGFSIPGTALTPAGEQLFVNTVLAVLVDEFQKPLQQEHYTPTGSYHGRSLGCLFSTNDYRVQVSAPGAINVLVASQSNLVLTVAGPRAEDLQSVRGISPQLLVPVTHESLAQGHDWLITVSYTGPMTNRTRIEYDMDLGYPSQTVSTQGALFTGILLAVGVLLALVAAWFLVRSRHSLSYAGQPLRWLRRRLRDADRPVGN